MRSRYFRVAIAHHAAVAGFGAANSFSFSGTLGKAEASFDLHPPVAPSLRPAIGFGLAMGAAAALRHADPAMASIDFEFNAAIPSPLAQISDAFSTITGIALHVGPVASVVPQGPRGTVFLVTGGKDSLYALRREEAAVGPLDGLPAVYLARGAESGWRTEIEIVRSICDKFRIELNVFELITGTCESAALALRFAARASWRELVTIGLARQFGDRIVTGINNDDVYRGTEQVSDPILYLSQLDFAVRALEQALGATVVTVPGEFEVYRAIRRDPLFNPVGSCLKPDYCHEEPCNKCKVFDVYESLLKGELLTPAQVDFVLSARYIGDAAIAQKVRAGVFVCG